MTRTRLIVLFVLALLVIAGALWLANQRSLPRTGVAENKVLPALGGEVNRISELRLVTAGDKSAVTLKRDEKFWRVMERDGYPADAAKLRKIILDLSELSVVEEKTANAANYPQLGVEDLASATASGVRLDLVGLEKPLSLIVGKSAAGGGNYVRVAGEAQSFLAKPLLSVEREPRNWLERTIVDIAPERVQQVQVKIPRKPAYTASRAKRDQAEYAVSGVPKGKSLSSPAAAAPIAGALAALSLDDAQRAQPTEQWPADTERAEFRLFDGTMLTVTGRKDGEKHRIRLAVGFDESQHRRFAQAPATKTEAAAAKGSTGAPSPASSGAAPDKTEPTLEEARSAAQASAARVEGWIYEIPAYKYETLFQPLDDLLSKS
jgi:Domain of unknown function (DUF4340)